MTIPNLPRLGESPSNAARRLGVNRRDVQTALEQQARRVQPRRIPIPGECHDCDCLSRKSDFTTNHMTAQTVRLPYTCRRIT